MPGQVVYVEIEKTPFWASVKWVRKKSFEEEFEYTLHGLKGYTFKEKEINEP